jgi:hypothetical protein
MLTCKTCAVRTTHTSASLATEGCRRCFERPPACGTEERLAVLAGSSTPTVAPACNDVTSCGCDAYQVTQRPTQGLTQRALSARFAAPCHARPCWRPLPAARPPRRRARPWLRRAGPCSLGPGVENMRANEPKKVFRFTTTTMCVWAEWHSPWPKDWARRRSPWRRPRAARSVVCPRRACVSNARVPDAYTRVSQPRVSYTRTGSLACTSAPAASSAATAPSWPYMAAGKSGDSAACGDKA